MTAIRALFNPHPPTPLHSSLKLEGLVCLPERNAAAAVLRGELLADKDASALR